MSQLSLLQQLKLQKAKREKNQSALEIFNKEVRDHPAWSEIKAKDRSEQIDNLVLVAYFQAVRPGTSSEICYRTVRNLANVLLSSSIGLLDYPTALSVNNWPSLLICKCGNVLAKDTKEWGLVSRCSICSGKNQNFYVEMFHSGIERSGFKISKHWTEWAQVQALFLRSRRLETLVQTRPLDLPISANHNSVTAQGDLN